jgi:hypothetical protein
LRVVPGVVFSGEIVITSPTPLFQVFFREGGEGDRADDYISEKD